MAEERDSSKTKMVKTHTPGLSDVDSSQFELVPLGKKAPSASAPSSRPRKPSPEPKPEPTKKRRAATSQKGSEQRGTRGASHHKGKLPPEKKPGTQKPKNTETVPTQESLYGNGVSLTNAANTPVSSGHILRQERRKKVKRAKRGELLRLLFFFLAIAILLTVTLLYRRKDTTILTGYITQGSIENLAKCQVYFLRKENTITTSHSGKVVANVNDGERVAAGAVIAYVVSSDMEAVLTELKKVESRIVAAQNSSDKTLTLLSEDLAVIDQAIEDATLRMTESTLQGSLTEFEAIEEELDELFARRNDLLMNVDTADQYIQNLQIQRDRLQTQLSGKVHEIISAEAGVVSFCTDGKEIQSTNWIQNLETTGAGSLNYDFLQGLQGSSSRSVGKEVSAGAVVARVTPNIDYYIAAVLEEGGDLVHRGSTVTVKSQDRRFAASAEVLSVQEEDGKRIAVLRSSKAMAGIATMRSLKGEMVVTYTEGMKVPLRSLTNWDAAGITAQIALIRANYVEYVYVNVLDKNSEYAIINSKYEFDTENESLSVRINDVYVVNPESVVEGQVIGS